MSVFAAGPSPRTPRPHPPRAAVVADGRRQGRRRAVKAEDTARSLASRAPGARLRLTAAVLAGALTLPLAPAALASHGSATSRLSGGDLRGGPDQAHGAHGLRLGVSLQQQLRYFGRAKEGSAAYTRRDLGSVVITTTQLGLRLRLPSQTALSVGLGAGVAAVSPPKGRSRQTTGLADTTVKLQQSLLPLLNLGGGPVQLEARVGLRLPTGRYAPDAQLSVTDVAAGSQGAIDVTVYNTQASLGAGAWGSQAGLGARLDLSDRLQLSAGMDAHLWWTQTSDKIRWGPALDARVGLLARLAQRRLGAWLDLVGEHQLKDEVPFEDPVLNVRAREKVGGRDSLAAQVGLSWRFSPALGCHAGARLPLWQRAGGVQLMETVSGMAGCGLSFGLSDPPPAPKCTCDD